MTEATAPAKVILFGEHAVVYGRPAIAAPVEQVRARARIEASASGTGCVIHARDTGEVIELANASPDHPLALAVRLALAAAGAPEDPPWRIDLCSEIPMASGLGSGAAVSAALVRAVFRHAGREPDPAAVSQIVFHSEERYHGAPSGIDNTVIAYEQPVWFVKGRPPETFAVARPFTLLIADSGVASPTRETVAAVRRAWRQSPEHYERLFDQMGSIAWAARQAIEAGRIDDLGPLMRENQNLLRVIGVSTDLLEALIEAALGAGAKGAKLSGGGGGGNVIVLVDPSTTDQVRAALKEAGAVRVFVTTVGGTSGV